MSAKVDYEKVVPGAAQAMFTVEECVPGSKLERSLLELVRLRASQMNGCAYCVDMHTKDARNRGEIKQRLYAAGVGRDAPFFTERERAALAWTEAVTWVSWQHVSDDVYQSAHRVKRPSAVMMALVTRGIFREKESLREEFNHAIAEGAHSAREA